MFGGGEWGLYCGVLVVERWLNNGWEEGLPSIERRRRGKREKVS